MSSFHLNVWNCFRIVNEGENKTNLYLLSLPPGQFLQCGLHPEDHLWISLGLVHQQGFDYWPPTEPKETNVAYVSQQTYSSPSRVPQVAIVFMYSMPHDYDKLSSFSLGNVVSMAFLTSSTEETATPFGTFILSLPISLAPWFQKFYE